MDDNIVNLLYIIEEEDLIISNNSLPIYSNNYISHYEAEYNDIIVNFIVIDSQTLLISEIKERIKFSNSYFQPLLGLCNYSNIGTGIVFEKPKGKALSLILKEASYELKIEIIQKLIVLYDFNNSRNLYIGDISLKNIYIYNDYISIFKHLLTSPYTSFNSFIKDNNELYHLPPEYINNNKNEIFDFNIESDSWTLGMLMFEILVGNKLYDLLDDCSITNKINNKVLSNILNSIPYNQYIKSVLKKLLKFDKKQRTCSKLIKQFFNKKLILEDKYLDNKKQIKECNLNESNENSLFEISKELNFNVLLNNDTIIEDNKNTNKDIKDLEKDNNTTTVTYNYNNEIKILNDLFSNEKASNEIETFEKDNGILTNLFDIKENDKFFNDDKTDNLNDLFENGKEIITKDFFVNQEKFSQDILKEVFNCKTVLADINRLEMLAQDYINSNSENHLEDLKELIIKKEVYHNVRLYENISASLWEALMCIAFEFLENDDIKSHYIISSILHTTIDKNKAKSTKNIALSKFHYAKAMKDYCNNYSLSLDLFLDSISDMIKIKEEDSQLGIQIKYYLGNLYDEMQMSEKSIETLLYVLNKQISLYTEEHIYTARTYNCLGIAEDNRGNLRQAKDYYQKSYGIFKYLSYGLETIDSVKVLNNIAGIFYKWENYTDCIKYYLTVLDVYKNKNGENNFNVAITFNNLSNCYTMIDNNDKALYYLNKAVEIFNNLLGASHIQTAMAYKNLGDLYYNLNDKLNAYEMFNKCVKIFYDKYGEDNDLYLSTLSKMRKIKLI